MRASSAFLALVRARHSGRRPRPRRQLPGPYSSQNTNQYPGPIYYNRGYAQYGLPGVGSFSLESDRAGATQSGNEDGTLQHVHALGRPVERGCEPVLSASRCTADPECAGDASDAAALRCSDPRTAAGFLQKSEARDLLSKSDVLKENGQVVWPATAPRSNDLDRARNGAEVAIRVAVKEFETDGKATISSVAEAKSQLFAYGKPALEQLARANREEAKKLLKFFASLEQELNKLAGE